VLALYRGVAKRTVTAKGVLDYVRGINSIVKVEVMFDGRCFKDCTFIRCVESIELY
jgi:hypothetical protein